MEKKTTEYLKENVANLNAVGCIICHIIFEIPPDQALPKSKMFIYL